VPFCWPGQRFNWKAVANEKEYPYTVELVVAGDKLDVESSRRMMNFQGREKFKRDMDGQLLEKVKFIFGGVFPIRTWPPLSRNSSAEKFRNPFGEAADAHGRPHTEAPATTPK
jgi:hypothetical protein